MKPLIWTRSELRGIEEIINQVSYDLRNGSNYAIAVQFHLWLLGAFY